MNFKFKEEPYNNLKKEDILQKCRDGQTPNYINVVDKRYTALLRKIFQVQRLKRIESCDILAFFEAGGFSLILKCLTISI